MTLQEWLEQHYTKLRAYAVYRCRGDREQADDLLQEMMAMILEGRIKVDIAKSPLTYLQYAMQTLRGRVQYGATRIRHDEGGHTYYQDQFVLMGDDEWLAAQTKPEPEAGFDFYPFFAQLPPRLQPVMELHLEGLSYREIGQRLNRPFQTVSDQIRQGVARLRVLILSGGDGLDGQGHGGGGRLSNAEKKPMTARTASAKRRGLAVPGESGGWIRRKPTA